MALYKVKKIYTYSEEVEIEAESSQEASDKAMYEEGVRNHDDILWDVEIINIQE